MNRCENNILIDKTHGIRYYRYNAMRRMEAHMSKGKEIKELREQMGMNRVEFCEYFGIPYRTVQDWEADKRDLPDYVLNLMKYKVLIEFVPNRRK